MESRETQSPLNPFPANFCKTRPRSFSFQSSPKSLISHFHKFSRYIRCRKPMKSQILTEKYLFPKTHSRNFDTCCEKVLDAPGITNDINANILSFNENLAVGLCSKLFILAPHTGNISTIIEKGNKLITSVK